MTQQDERQLGAYLDGLLGNDERAAFEQRLEREAGLRAAVDVQQRVDASLSRMYAPPSPEQVLARARARAREGTRQRIIPFPVRVVGLAAAIVLVAFAAWQWWSSRPVSGTGPYPPLDRQVSLVQAYRYYESHDFEPAWTCENDQQLAASFWNRFDQPLVLHDAPEDVQAAGLSYVNAVSRDTLCLLARVKGEPVCVFVDLAESDTGQPEPSWWSGLHLFRRRIGRLVAYELTPFSQSHVIGHLQVPDVDEEWLREGARALEAAAIGARPPTSRPEAP